MIKGINVLDGKVTYDEFNIDITLPLAEQAIDLQQDMLQIEYGDFYCVDVGWHPELEPKGFFVIQVIKNCDWVTPVLKSKIKAKDIALLPQKLNEAIKLASKLKNTTHPSENDYCQSV